MVVEDGHYLTPEKAMAAIEDGGDSPKVLHREGSWWARYAWSKDWRGVGKEYM